MSEESENMDVPNILEAGAKTFRQRHALYGNNYKRFGNILMELFPSGIMINTAEDANRLNLLIQIQGKLTRYAEGITRGNGGHKDSAHDTCVYAAMLEEMTDDDLPF
jgi:hypothetical protein